MQPLPSESQNLIQKEMIRAIATKDGSDPLFRDLNRVEANATEMANPHYQLDTLGERKSQLKNSYLRLYCGHVSGDIFLINGYWKGSVWSMVVVPSLGRWVWAIEER